jgi:hypothetical protein
MADPIFGRRQSREDVDIGDPAKPRQGYLYEAEPRLPGPPSPQGQPPVINPPPLYQPVTQTTPTTPPPTSTTAYDPRFEAYREWVTRWQQGRLDQDELRDLEDYRRSGRTARWDQQLGLAPLGQAPVAPATPPAAAPPAEQAPTPAPEPAPQPQGTFGERVARRLGPIPSPTRTLPTGQEERKPASQLIPEDLGYAFQIPGAVLNEGLRSALPGRTGETAGNIGQVGWNLGVPLLLASRVPGLRQVLGFPRALLRLPDVVRRLQRLEQVEKAAAASSKAARTITKIPPPVEVPPGTTFH